jgi:UDP-glucose 4-epimerase
MRIAVTGASGKLGRVVAAELSAVGHEVLRIDAVGARAMDFVQVDLTDYGQVVDVLAGLDDRLSQIEAIVHLAAVPAPGIVPDVATFHNNLPATFNVFQAARRLGIRRIVYASSETLLGLPLEIPPAYIPIDEEFDSRPESVYALVKHLEEELARKLVRWDPELSITALRFSNVMAPEDYEGFAAFQNDSAVRRWNLWGYIDARDGAQAVLRALEKNRPGFDTFIIAAADTVMETPNSTLIAEQFPHVPLTRELDPHETLLSIDKARRLLGYEPRHSWRDPA